MTYDTINIEKVNELDGGNFTLGEWRDIISRLIDNDLKEIKERGPLREATRLVAYLDFNGAIKFNTELRDIGITY